MSEVQILSPRPKLSNIYDVFRLLCFTRGHSCGHNLLMPRRLLTFLSCHIIPFRRATMRNLTILLVLAIRIINRLALYWEKIFQMTGTVAYALQGHNVYLLCGCQVIEKKGLLP